GRCLSHCDTTKRPPGTQRPRRSCRLSTLPRSTTEPYSASNHHQQKSLPTRPLPPSGHHPCVPAPPPCGSFGSASTCRTTALSSGSPPCSLQMGSPSCDPLASRSSSRSRNCQATPLLRGSLRSGADE